MADVEKVTGKRLGWRRCQGLRDAGFECQAEEFGLTLFAARAIASFFTCRQLIEQKVLIRVQSGKSLIPPLSSKSVLFLCFSWEDFTAFCCFQL